VYDLWSANKGVPLVKGTETIPNTPIRRSGAPNKGVPLVKGTETPLVLYECGVLNANKGVPLVKGTETGKPVIGWWWSAWPTKASPS